MASSAALLSLAESSGLFTAFMQQALAELDHRQAFRQPGSDADFTAAQLLLQQRSWQQQEA